jgi:hypothetical protein
LKTQQDDVWEGEREREGEGEERRERESALLCSYVFKTSYGSLYPHYLPLTTNTE